jgi:hypothetical protein
MNAFTLPCPMCGEPDASISLMFSGGNFNCNECSAEFELSLIEGLVQRWGLLLPWLKAMPDGSEEITIDVMTGERVTRLEATE